LNLTRDHGVGGTPAFMSPEQVMSDRPLDGRSDIYAVGCLAYWLVTGQPVFTGRTAIEIMMHHAQTVPVRHQRALKSRSPSDSMPSSWRVSRRTRTPAQLQPMRSPRSWRDRA
jgi:serine/threonine protein kinase